MTEVRVSSYERRNALLELLAEEGHIEVSAAAQRLSVSATTIRRDLDTLARQRMLTRTHGGAVAVSVSQEPPRRHETPRRLTEQKRIGLAAARLTPRRATVGLNGGPTTTEVGRALAARVESDGNDGQVALTVVTSALNIAEELVPRSNVKTVVIGGMVQPHSHELIGPLASDVLEQLTLDYAILGVDGIDARAGASTHHEDKARISLMIAQRARQVMVVADSSKIGKQVLARMCAIEAVDVLVTDSGASDAAVAQFAAHGVRVFRAE